MRRKIPQRGFLIRRGSWDGAPFSPTETEAGGPIFTAAGYIRRSQSTEGLAAKITSNWMGERGGGLASTPVSVQPINPLQSLRQPREVAVFSLLRCRHSKTYWDRKRYRWDSKHRSVCVLRVCLPFLHYRSLDIVYFFQLSRCTIVVFQLVTRL